MAVFGHKSGFDNYRDLALFLIGTGGLAYSVINGQVSTTLITVFAGLMVSPYVIRADQNRAARNAPPVEYEDEEEPTPPRKTVRKTAAKRAIRKR